MRRTYRIYLIAVFALLSAVLSAEVYTNAATAERIAMARLGELKAAVKKFGLDAIPRPEPVVYYTADGQIVKAPDKKGYQLKTTISDILPGPPKHRELNLHVQWNTAAAKDRKQTQHLRHRTFLIEE